MYGSEFIISTSKVNDRVPAFFVEGKFAYFIIGILVLIPAPLLHSFYKISRANSRFEDCNHCPALRNLYHHSISPVIIGGCFVPRSSQSLWLPGIASYIYLIAFLHYQGKPFRILKLYWWITVPRTIHSIA